MFPYMSIETVKHFNMGAFLSKFLFSAELTKVTVFSWNVNNDRRVENGYATEKFGGFTCANRIDRIMKDLENTQASVIHLFEINRGYLQKFVDFLTLLGYECRYGSYAPNQTPDESFYYVTAFKTDVFDLVDSYMYWFTSTPKIGLTDETRPIDMLLIDNQEQYEKGTLITVLTKKDTGATIVLSVNHWPLREKYQTTCAIMLAEHLDELSEQYPDAIFVTTGDFNPFPSFEGRTVKSFVESSKNLYIEQHSDPNIDVSFVGYPYDVGLKLGSQMRSILETTKDMDAETTRCYFAGGILGAYGGPITSMLDLVFTHGIDEVDVTVLTNGVNIADLTELFETQAKTGKPFMPSDHFATLVQFNC